MDYSWTPDQWQFWNINTKLTPQYSCFLFPITIAKHTSRDLHQLLILQQPYALLKMPNCFLARPYQWPEPYYQVPIPGTYPTRFARLPVSGTTPATAVSTVYPTYQYIQTMQAQPTYMQYRQPQLWLQGG
ncbi:hypothetical protein N8I77_004778 [Diaporthe amygdali]|uniref:Uncharacterized protein n=1 Tax=Phomopsis amygdali TaxID=1214568 RepID=A0AAD9W692_PHOAM|nr:hypothetical protein N8I77_004778 [Diaporthe amygdali]